MSVYTTASVQNRGISFHLFHDNCPHPVSRCEQIRKCDLHSTKKFCLRNVSKTLISVECKLKLQECNGDDGNGDDEDGNGGKDIDRGDDDDDDGDDHVGASWNLWGGRGRKLGSRGLLSLSKVIKNTRRKQLSIENWDFISYDFSIISSCTIWTKSGQPWWTTRLVNYHLVKTKSVLSVRFIQD